MRIRSIKPEFWDDSALADLSDGAKLFYIGLWMVADDHGWLRWDVPAIGAALYPYRGRAEREADIADYAAQLGALSGKPRVEVYRCGHAQVPRVSVHQLPGRPYVAVESEHEEGCKPNPRQSRATKAKSGRLGKGGRVKLSEGGGVVRGGDETLLAPEGAASLRDILGDPETIIGPRDDATVRHRRLTSGDASGSIGPGGLAVLEGEDLDTGRPKGPLTASSGFPSRKRGVPPFRPASKSAKSTEGDTT